MNEPSTYTYSDPKTGKLSIPHINSSLLMRRDRLISMLLQDRSSLRIISAPSGFGKTCLAYEYARRLFSQSKVCWIQADTPDFLKNLDNGRIFPRYKKSSSFDLIVIDALPHLDEERADTLIDCIDKIIFDNTEILATTLPSTDVLRSKILDRTLIGAPELLVTERDCLSAQLSYTDAEGPGINVTTQQAKNIIARQKQKLFGLTPQLIWNHGTLTPQTPLTRFFNETLPLEVLRSVFCMLLIGEGTFRDLSHIGVSLKPEIEMLLAQDYPFIELDLIHHTFKSPDFSFKDLRVAIDSAKLSRHFLGGSLSFAEKSLEVIAAHNNFKRAMKVLDEFCSQSRCLNWLNSHGWTILNRCHAHLAEQVFNNCEESSITGSDNLLALFSWTSGLQGKAQEAQFYASQILNKEESKQNSFAACMAYLSLIAFNKGETGVFGKRMFSEKIISTPKDFLLRVVDLCSEKEVAKALNLHNGHYSKFGSNKNQKPLKEREYALTVLFTENEMRFGKTQEYQLGLHFLFAIESSQARKLLCQLGAGVVVRARRNGVCTITESLLIQDLWTAGFFGLSSKPTDIRDTKMLDAVANIMNHVGISATGQPFATPWEALSSRHSSSNKQTNNTPPTYQSNQTPAKKGMPILYVRMFGAFEIYFDDHILEEKSWRRKSRIMFSLLTLGMGRDITRDFLFEQLWPDMDRARALDNFYSVWSNTATVLKKGPFMERSGEFCRINTAYVNSDVAEFEEMVRRMLTERDNLPVLLDLYARIESLYRGALIPSEKDVPFLNAQREKYKNMYVDAMISASQQALTSKDAHLSLWFARKAMDEDAKREDAYNTLIRAQIAGGQRCCAIRTYFQCRQYLREELGLDPSIETSQLYSQLISQDPSLLKLDPSSFK